MICLKKVFERGTAGQEAAEYIRGHVTKPVVGYVVGISAPPGKTMDHAGAIITDGGGTAKEKIETLEGAGVVVAGSLEDVAGKILGMILVDFVFQDLIDLRFSSQKLIILGSFISFPITSASW